MANRDNRANRDSSLELMLAGAFRGVIVADAVGVCAAGFTLTGALVTLSRSPQAGAMHRCG